MTYRRFTRRKSSHHQLLAREAIPGERPNTFGGRPVKPAIDGQWFCENPQNNHQWLMSDDDFWEFYRPLDEPVRPQSKKTKKERVNQSNEIRYKRRGKKGQ